MNQTPPTANTRKTILVVDDDGLVLDYVSVLLEKSNYHVLRAVSGELALRQAEAYNGTINLLLSDFEMPGMTGIELATAVCKQRPGIKVLLMSGFDGGMLVLNEGWHFLAKPFVESQLRAIVVTLLNDVPPFRASASS